MLTFLESIPDELSLQILKSLKGKDILACRLVSTSMCAIIDRLFSPKFCIILNEKSEQHFINPPHFLLTKPCINSNFNTMKVGSLACCSKLNQRRKHNGPCNIISLRMEQFTFITELEFSQFIRKSVFQQVIKITARNLQVLTINSAVLGGVGDLFKFKNGLDWKDDSNKTMKNRHIIQRMFTLWKNLIPFGSLKRSRDMKPNSEAYSFEDKESLTLLRLNELHIKITYVAPTTSERQFSPHVLVENMKGLRFLPVPNLQAFNVTVERSEDGELFYFTLNSLLQTIPMPALGLGSLQSLSIITPKVKPPLRANMKSYCDYDHLAAFKMMKLSELTVRILDGYMGPKPEILRDLLSTQSTSLRALTIAGFPD